MEWKRKEYNREGSLKFKGEYIKMPENMFSILVIFLHKFFEINGFNAFNIIK